MPDFVARPEDFSGGEIGPQIEGKLSSSKRQKGVRRLKDAIITFGGTVEKRPGLRYAATRPEWTPTNPTANVQYAPRITRWAGSRDEPDFLLHMSHRNGVAVFCFFSADGVLQSDAAGDVFEITTPYQWEHVWHNEDEFAQTDSQPGLKFVQSSDVMTITHPDYPVHSLERTTDVNNPWVLTQTVFDFEQRPPSGLYIQDYRPRSRSEGFDSDRAEGRPVDFAVTAYNETFGESRLGLALTDSRMFDPENDAVRNLELLTRDYQIAGFDLFDDYPGLHVRIALRDDEGFEEVKEGFPVGMATYIINTRGTTNIGRRVFQVRGFRGEIAKDPDNRVTFFQPVSGIAGGDRDGVGWRGPWVILDPAPPSEAFENIWSRRVAGPEGSQSGIIGPTFIGDEQADSETPDLRKPYNLGPLQIPEDG